MDTAFITILQKLITEQGKEALFDPRKGKSLLADYTGSEYKKESRLIVQALEAGVPRAIATTGELDLCVTQQVRLLREDYYVSEEAAADVVDTLALVLRGQEKPEKLCKACGKELQDEWKMCPYCGSSIEGREASPTKAVPRDRRPNKTTAEDCFNRGKMFLDRGDVDTAILEFTEAIGLDHNFAEAYKARGGVYSARGLRSRINKHEDDAIADFDRAMADYTQAIRLDPNDAEAYAARGSVYGRKLDPANDIADCNQAIRLDPNLAIAYAYRGGAYSNKGDKDRAITDCDQAIRLDPNLAIAYAYRGFVYGSKGDKDQAIADYSQALRLDPKDAITYSNRGTMYKSKGNYAQALTDYERALKIDPNFSLAKNQLAELKRLGY